jgi:hypothetical protein
MINFPIHRFTPQLIHLRLYLVQMLNDTFGLSESLAEKLESQFGNSSIETIETLDQETIEDLLDWNAPEFLYVFSTSSDTQHPLLEALNEYDLLSTNPLLFKLPTLYTGIKQVTFDRNGLIIVSSYMNQIYSLYQADGTFLLGPCHDLDLGANGQILSRSSGEPIWERHVFDDHGLTLIKYSSHLTWEDNFPYVSQRDCIPQMFNTKEEYVECYPSLHPDNHDDVVSLLEKNPNAWKVLKEFYLNDKNLASLAVQSNKLAFTLLSNSLYNDRIFVLDLLNELKEPGYLYSYLPSDLQKDKDIIMFCYKEWPDALFHLGVIDDKEILRHVFLNELNYGPEKYLELANPAIRGDKRFLLELAPYSVGLLNFLPPELAADEAFVQQVKTHYEEAEKERSKQLLGDDYSKLFRSNLLDEEQDDLPF